MLYCLVSQWGNTKSEHEAEEDESYFCTHIPTQCVFIFIYMCIYKYMYVYICCLI